MIANALWQNKFWLRGKDRQRWFGGITNECGSNW
jgi:hypothetical protein